MKYFLSIILTFLISLPTCGMVFSGEMDMMDHHDDIEIGSMHMDEAHVDTLSHQDIGSGMYDCCPNTSSSIIERNTTPSSCLENPPITTGVIYVFPHLEILAKIETYFSGVHKPDGPPDPSEYISLIGNSVKILN